MTFRLRLVNLVNALRVTWHCLKCPGAIGDEITTGRIGQTYICPCGYYLVENH